MTYLHLRLPLHLLHLEHQLLLHSHHLLLVLLLGRQLLGRVCVLCGQGMGSCSAAARPPSSCQLPAHGPYLPEQLGMCGDELAVLLLQLCVARLCDTGLLCG